MWTVKWKRHSLEAANTGVVAVRVAVLIWARTTPYTAFYFYLWPRLRRTFFTPMLRKEGSGSSFASLYCQSA